MATVSIVPRCHIVALSVGAQTAHLCHVVKHCGGAQKLTGENLFLPKGENTIVASKKREDGERGVGDFKKKFVQKTGEKTYNVCLNNLHCGCGCVAGKLEIPNG